MDSTVLNKVLMLVTTDLIEEWKDDCRYIECFSRAGVAPGEQIGEAEGEEISTGMKSSRLQAQRTSECKTMMVNINANKITLKEGLQIWRNLYQAQLDKDSQPGESLQLCTFKVLIPDAPNSWTYEVHVTICDRYLESQGMPALGSQEVIEGERDIVSELLDAERNQGRAVSRGDRTAQYIREMAASRSEDAPTSNATMESMEVREGFTGYSEEGESDAGVGACLKSALCCLESK